MYIHLYCETGTSHTKYHIQKQRAEGEFKYFVYGMVVENRDEP